MPTGQTDRRTDEQTPDRSVTLSEKCGQRNEEKNQKLKPSCSEETVRVNCREEGGGLWCMERICETSGLQAAK